MPLRPAQLHFNESGTPFSDDFDDVYFSNDNGVEESLYVFLKNNFLPERWQKNTNEPFVIFETGFGTGLNFLLTWQAYQESESSHPLHFVSCEKFPLEKEDLSNALASWPALENYSNALLAQYPILEPGCHRLTFNGGNVILDLWLGDVAEILPRIYTEPSGLVDAWYLDGFAPSKNPEMWQDSLFQQMSRLSKHNATVSTFTAAGIVKRGLISAGFALEKVKGFGRKRDMLRGNYQPILPPSKSSHLTWQARRTGPWSRHCNKADNSAPVAIIGAGMAAANLALSLVQKGYRVDIYYQEEKLPAGASGNLAGGFYPLLTADWSLQSQFYVQAFQFGLNRYNSLSNEGFEVEQDMCGVVFPAFNEKVALRQQNLLDNQCWSQALLKAVTPDQTTELCGLNMPYPGLYIEKGGWISPESLTKALLAKAATVGEVTLHKQHKLIDIRRDKQWQLTWQNGATSTAETLVLANSFESLNFTQTHPIPLQSTRGQVEHVPAQKALQGLRAVVCHKGYITPECRGIHAIGSSYVKDDMETDIRRNETETNIATMKKALSKCQWTQEITHQGEARASIRNTTPDHIPVVGAVPDFNKQTEQFWRLSKSNVPSQYPPGQHQEGLFIFAGLGSRGLCTAPLAAEILASQISQHPYPVSQDILNMLAPNRWLIRNLIRGEE